MIGLKDLRKQRGIGLKPIAVRLGVTTTDIARMEYPSRFPPFVQLVQLRRALGVDIKTFWERLETMDGDPAIAKLLRARVKKIEEQMPASCQTGG